MAIGTLPAARAHARLPWRARVSVSSSRESGCSTCQVVTSRNPIARLERLALAEGRNAVSSSSSTANRSKSVA